MVTMVTTIIDDVKEIEKEMNVRIQFHKRWGLEKVKFTIEYDFQRGFEVINERTFEHVTANYLQLVEYIERVIQLAASSPPDAAGYREALYLIVDQQLFDKLTLCERALDNITEVHEAFLNGKRILTYKASPNRR